MNAHFNTSVVVPAKLSFVTSQQPSFSPLAWRRGCKVCTCWRLSAWSSLIHGGKSAPTDTNCDSEGPINGLGRLVYMTVMLPRNVSGSKTNNTYLLAYLHQCLLYTYTINCQYVLSSFTETPLFVHEETLKRWRHKINIDSETRRIKL